MLRLFKNNQENNNNSTKTNSAMLRLKKDKENLDIPKNTQIIFSDENENEFMVMIKPNKESLWHQAEYNFKITINANYPIDAPKILLMDNIFHPNIDEDGKICLNILREDWSPVFNLNTIIIGLNTLFDEPNPTDPLNQEAGELMRENYNQFKVIVRKTLQGYSYNQKQFKRFI